MTINIVATSNLGVLSAFTRESNIKDNLENRFCIKEHPPAAYYKGWFPDVNLQMAFFQGSGSFVRY
jgi:hypothetical protein